MRILFALEKIPNAVARFAETGNDPIYVRRPYIYGLEPYLSVDQLDNKQSDLTEVEYVFNAEELDDERRDFIQQLRAEIPIPDKDDDPDEYAAMVSCRERWNSLRDSYLDCLPKVCGQLELCLSEESRRHIQAHFNESWNLYRHNNLHRMLYIIRLSHTVSTGAKPSLIDINRALNELQSLNQGESTLEEYYESFTEQLEKCRTIGVNNAKLTTDESIYQFVNGVTDINAAIVRDTLILNHGSATFPQTLNEAFVKISQAIKAREEANTSKTTKKSSKYVAKATVNKKHNQKREKNNKKMEKVNNKTNTKNKNKTTNSQLTCGHCRKKGHVAKDCFALKRLMETNGEATKTQGKGGSKTRQNKRTRDDDDSTIPADFYHHDDEDDDDSYNSAPRNKRGRKSSDQHARFVNIAAVTTRRAHANIVLHVGAGSRSRSDGIISGTVILDTGANVNIVNRPDILRRTRNGGDGIVIKGVSSDDVTPRCHGTFGPFGKAYCVPSSSFCILAFHMMRKIFDVSYSAADNTFDLHKRRDGTLVGSFVGNDEGMYVLQASNDDEVCELLQTLTNVRTFNSPKDPSKSRHIRRFSVQHGNGYQRSDEEDSSDSDSDDDSSADEQEESASRQLGETVKITQKSVKNITSKERERAVLAMRYHEMLNHPSDRALKEMFENGNIRGCDLKAKDVTLGRLLEGPCACCQKAKATLKRRIPHEPSAPPPYVGHTYHADICFISGKQPHLRICEDVTKYGALIPLAKKDNASIMDALQIWFGTMLANTNNAARRLRTDNEVVFSSLSDQLAKTGVLLQQAPSGNHSGKIERCTRTDRDGLRTLLSSLPYKVPSNLHSLAAIDVVKMRNLIPNNSTDGKSPYTIVCGRTPTLDDIAVPWGSIVHATNPNPPADKSEPKAELAVVVGHNFESKAGSVDVLLVTPGSTTIRIVNRPARLLSPASQKEVNIVRDFMQHLGKKNPPTADFEHLLQYNPPTTTAPTADGARSVNDQEAFGDDTSPMEADEIPPAPNINPELPFLKQSQPASPKPKGVADAAESPPKPKAAAADAKVAPSATHANELNQEATHTIAPEPAYALRNRLEMRLPERYINNVQVRYILNLTVTKAIATYGKAAEEAIITELLQLLAKKVWKPIMHATHAKKSKHNRILPCSMFLKEKFLANGLFEKLKARLVAGGHMTDPAKYSKEEKTSETVKHETLMAVLAIAASQDRGLESFDFPGAYLYGKLKHAQVMRIPKNIAKILIQVDKSYTDFLQKDGSILVNVTGALYGLPEAGKLWFEKLRKTLTRLGYKQAFDDPCVFQRTDAEGEVSTLCVHVDDMLHTFTKGAKKLREELIDALEREYKDIKKSFLTHKNSISYLGMDIKRSTFVCVDGVTRSGLSITMPNFLEECLVDGNTAGTAKTPATAELFNINKKLKPIGSPNAFLAKLMKLMYLARKCRHDILLPCCFLATRSKEPTSEDWAKLSRIYRYLNGTRGLPLNIAPDSLQLRAYVDASYAVHKDAKGQSGRVVAIGNIGGPAIVKTTKQHLVALSSTEAELISLAESTTDVLMMKRILRFLGVKSSRTVVFQDNKSTKHMAELGRGGKSGNSKHIGVRYFFIKQHIDNGDLTLEYLPTEEMTADILTKPLVGNLFYKMRAKLLNLPQPKGTAVPADKVISLAMARDQTPPLRFIL